jgi:6-phosphofructokinase 1
VIRAEGFPIGARELEDTINKKTGIDTKTVVLGYVQRGGSPTAQDRLLASTLGHRAVELLKDNVINKAVGTICGQVREFDLGEALLMKKESKAHLIEMNYRLAR